MNPPPRLIPKTLIDQLKDKPEIMAFLNEILRSNYLLWSSINKNVGFYNSTGVTKGAALTASDTNTPNSGDATTDAIIANLQTRVDELEARLTNVNLFG